MKEFSLGVSLLPGFSLKIGNGFRLFLETGCPLASTSNWYQQAVPVVTSMMGKGTDGCRVPYVGRAWLGGTWELSPKNTGPSLELCMPCSEGGARAGVTAQSLLSPQTVLCPAQGLWRKCCMGTAVRFQLCGGSLGCLVGSSEELCVCCC